MKRILGVLLAVVFTFSLVVYSGCEADAKEKPVKIAVAVASVHPHPYVLCANWTRDRLKETGSSVTMEVHAGAILGGEREAVEGMMLGTIEMSYVSDMLMAALIPGMAFANFPGIYKDYDDVRKMYWHGWIGEKIKKLAEAKGIKILGFNDNDFRWITNSRLPITKPEDLKGLKLRVPEVPFLVDFFKEFGVLPTPVPYSELAMALQQGVVDGQETGPTSIYPAGFYLFNKYITMANHSYSAAPVAINIAKWNSLSGKQQKELQAAVDYAIDKTINYNIKSREEAITKMKEKGAKIVELTPELQQAFFKAGKKLVANPKYVKAFGQDVIDKMYPSK